ncbi:hypothetical protein MTO96_025949 [Rhipicephalus appendiculatus]
MEQRHVEQEARPEGNVHGERGHVVEGTRTSPVLDGLHGQHRAEQGAPAVAAGLSQHGGKRVLAYQDVLPDDGRHIASELPRWREVRETELENYGA